MNTKYKVECLRPAGPMPSSFVEGAMYFNIHIRLHTPSYLRNGRPAGFVDSEARMKYAVDMREIVKQAGFDVNERSHVYSSIDPYASIFIHPQDLSGCMTKAQAAQLTDIISASNGPSAVTSIDIYEPLEIIYDYEISKRISYYEKDIKEQILERHKTSRRNKFIRRSLTASFNDLPGLQLHKTQSLCDTSFTTLELAQNKVSEIFYQMLSDGLLVAHPLQEAFIRAANKTEMAIVRRASA